MGNHMTIYLFINDCTRSMGKGKIMVEFFSAEMELRVCRYLSCNATGVSLMIKAASFRACEALCSPSAANT